MALGPLLPDVSQVVDTIIEHELIDPEPPTDYGKSLLFNFGPEGTVGFEYSQANKVTVVDDIRSLLTWINKAIRTPRGVYEIYGNQYGTQLAKDLGQINAADYVGVGSDDIRQCLTIHPLVEDVIDIQFLSSTEPDSLILRFTVLDRISGHLDITVNL